MKKSNKSNDTNNLEEYRHSTELTKFNYAEQALLGEIDNYFSVDRYLKVFIDYVSGNTPISLRVLDWFVSNYVKKKDVHYKIKVNNRVKRFVIYAEYQAQLKRYTKNLFDPFCRKDKILYHYNIDGKNECIVTALAQLNFFRWAIKYKIINHVEEHASEIITDMKLNNSSKKKSTVDVTDSAKRRELSSSAYKRINVYQDDTDDYNR
jgi:hypothetical protein